MPSVGDDARLHNFLIQNILCVSLFSVFVRDILIPTNSYVSFVLLDLVILNMLNGFQLDGNGSGFLLSNLLMRNCQLKDNKFLPLNTENIENSI